MKFEVFAEFKYESIVPSTLILNIQPFKTIGQQVLEERFESSLILKNYEWYANAGEKRFKVLEVPVAKEIVFTYSGTI
jgi:hypothetical protein